jgi:hypothetical protein
MQQRQQHHNWQHPHHHLHLQQLMQHQCWPPRPTQA